MDLEIFAYTKVMSDISLNQVVKLFLSEDSKVDTEALRMYVLRHLTDAHERMQYIRHNPILQESWRDIKDSILSQGTAGNEAWVRTVAEVESVDKKLHEWMEDHVDSKEDFDFSVQAKAVEINSGNQDYDYFMALLIRHDQLLATVLVYEEVIKKFETILQIHEKNLADIPEWAYLAEKTIDERIFEMAEEMYRLRSAD